MATELERLRRFRDAVYRAAGPRPQIETDEPEWNVDLFEVERQVRRAEGCETCGGQMPLWSLHVCGPNGGTFMPLDSDAARALVGLSVSSA